MSLIDVLVVEDQLIVSEDIKYIIENLGYNVVATASNSEDAINLAIKHKPHIIVMDINLNEGSDTGGLNGIQTVKVIQKNLIVKVIYLTGDTKDLTLKDASLTDFVQYIKKPFSEESLSYSLKLASNMLANIVDLGHSYYFSTFDKRLFFNKSIVKISKHEQLFLSLMIEHLGEVVEYDRICKNVWINEEIKNKTSAIRTLVSRLKSKLKDAACIIENISNEGYRIKSID